MDLPIKPPSDIPEIFPEDIPDEFPMKQFEHKYVFVLIENSNGNSKVISVHDNYFPPKNKKHILVGPIPYYKGINIYPPFVPKK